MKNPLESLQGTIIAGIVILVLMIIIISVSF